jgi:hypothetical protein
MKAFLLLPLALFATALAPLHAADDPIDFNRARELFDRQNRGEKLTPDERDYIKRALMERKGALPPPEVAPWTQHLIPLTELAGAKYQDQDGGLYGGARNEPPKGHLEAALREAGQIRPLNAAGEPAPDGKIVFLSVGMSNATQEFSTFIHLAEADSALSPRVLLLDGAQGGQTGIRWADPSAPLWHVLDSRLATAGVSPQQVQVIWVKQAEAGPAQLGAFPKHAEALRDHLATGLGLLREKFPNLRLAYLSSRIYAGYARTPLNPEPYAYESAFAVRWLIQDQIGGKPALNFDPARGPVKSPLLLWGPYLWADGQTPRHADQLTYLPADFGPDGTHPSNSGREKVAHLLLDFFKTDPTAKSWFLKPQ